MKLTIFSVEEANQVVADVRPMMRRLIESKHELDRLNARHDVLQLTTVGAAPSNPDVQEQRDLMERRMKVVEFIQRGVKDIHRRGALVKDLDKGLLDFYTLLGDRLVFLCWQMGESEVAHWHTIEGGFSSRQPLDPSELE